MLSTVVASKIPTLVTSQLYSRVPVVLAIRAPLMIVRYKEVQQSRLTRVVSEWYRVKVWMRNKILLPVACSLAEEAIDYLRRSIFENELHSSSYE